MYGNQHTSTVAVINHAALALSPSKSCPNERCSTQYIVCCSWQKEKQPDKIGFNDIYLNQQETSAKNDFIENLDLGRLIFPKRNIKNIYTIN